MLDNIFDDLFETNRSINRMFDARTNYRRNYIYGPALNLYENNDENIIVAKLPGLKKEDITIVYKDNSIKISGERKKEENEKFNIQLKEKFNGKFERSIMLPEKIDMEKIEAEFRNGLLIVKLPKSLDSKPIAITFN